jgi:phage replication O-like protein O
MQKDLPTRQLSNRRASISNDVLNYLAEHRISDSEWRCLLVIWQKTYGQLVEKAFIFPEEFAINTCLPEPVITRALDRLAQQNIILRNAPFTDGRRMYACNERVEFWNLIRPSPID